MSLKELIRESIRQQRPAISTATLVRYTNAIHNIYSTLGITDRRLKRKDIQRYFDLKVETNVAVSYLRYIQATVNTLLFPNKFIKFLPPRIRKRRAEGGLRNSYQKGALTEELVLQFFADITDLYESTSNYNYYYTCLIVFLMITMGIRGATIKKLTMKQIADILDGSSVRNQIYVYKSSVIISRSIVLQLSNMLVLPSGLLVRTWLRNNITLRGDGEYTIPRIDFYKVLERFPYLRTDGRVSTYGIKEGQPKIGYGFGYHDYRRFAATTLYRLTNNLSLVQTFLVHASPAVTNKYLKPHVG
jgi:integrase